LEERAERADAALEEAKRAEADALQVQRRMESDRAQLADGFSRQLEERLREEGRLKEALAQREEAASKMVEKRVARAWLVNFVENDDRRDELLRLMSSCWEFEREVRALNLASKWNRRQSASLIIARPSNTCRPHPYPSSVPGLVARRVARRDAAASDRYGR
tara:strand:+ start:1475 stop:1960 length:486 start_codon:yes stop_codon:yes gene_type:complete